MPVAMSTVSKGRIFRKLDKFLSKPEAHFLDDLRKPENFQLAKLGENRGLLEGQGQFEHADKEWFGGKSERAAWWPSNPQKQEIVRQTFVKATEVALASDPPKPIVTYWVYGSESFEGMVGESDQQVTVFLLTPPPPSMPTTQTRPHVDEKLWVIAPDARIAAIQEGYAPAERPQAAATDTPGVSTMQMRSTD
jgi:hypothetical protein